MARWTCPRCDREFGRTNQSHVCVPGNSVDATFAGRHPVQRQIYDAIAAHLATLGPFHADAVQVGVFLKSDRKFAELRPKQKWLEVSIYLSGAIDHPRIARTVQLSSERTVNIVKLHTVEEFDDDVRSWITDAYDEATA